ncbi:PD-(D/E)XK nuclease superfamily protein [Candidatus Darwinibacter acetoxidans]
MTNGTTANQTGQRAERVIACMLHERGYSFERQVYLGKSIYGHKLYCDFLVSNIPEFPNGLIIESKWQGSAGSADEKFPYLIENVRQVFPCPTVIVIAGGGHRPGAVTWLKAQVDGKKVVAALNLEEFLCWMNKDLSDPAGLPERCCTRRVAGRV